MNVLKHMKQSLHPKNPITTLSVGAICIALYVILSMFQIQLSPTLKIVFSSLMLGVSATLLGFFPSLLVATIADILQYMLFPTGPFFIGFTFNTMITSIIYSLFFYKQTLSISKVIIARVLVVVICNLILTPIWLSILMGDTAILLSLPRIIKNITLFPIDCALLYFTIRQTKKMTPSKLM